MIANAITLHYTILNVTEITFVNLLSVEQNNHIQGYRYSSRNLGFQTSRQIDDSRGIIDSREVSNQDFYDFSKFTEQYVRNLMIIDQILTALTSIDTAISARENGLSSSQS